MFVVGEGIQSMGIRNCILVFRPVFIIFFIVTFRLAAQKIDMVIPGADWQSNQTVLSFRYAFSPVRGIDNREPMFALSAFREAKRYYAGIGIQYSLSDFSAESDVAVYLLSMRHVKAGPYALFNYRRMFDCMTVYNFLCGTLLKLLLCRDTILLQMDAEYMRKVTELDILRKYIPYLTDNDLAVNITLAKQWKNFSVYGSFASYEPFLYSLSLQPKFSLGIGYMFDNGLSATVQGTVSYSDMFTLTAYVDHVTVRTGLLYRFKS